MVVRNIVLTLVVGIGLGYVAWTLSPPAWTPLKILGVCLAVPGFVLWTIARFELGSSFVVTAQAKQLVTHGLYSRFLNPIYYFGSFTVAGFILVMGRTQWLLIFVLLVPLQIKRARKEAKVLEEAFGEQYRAYRAGTWF